VIITRPQDLVDQIAVAGHKNQPLGILVQPADRENSHRVPDKALNIVALGAVGGADNAHRLVQSDEYLIFFSTGLNDLAVDHDRVRRQYLITNAGALAVDSHITLLDISVGLAPRTNAALADVFVQACGRRLGHAGHRLGVGSIKRCIITGERVGSSWQ